MKRMYLDLARKDVFWFKTLCKDAGVQLEIQAQPDGMTRCLFAETFVPVIQKILDTPEAKRPQPRKASLIDQIDGTRKPKIPDNPPTDSENRWAEEKLAEELKEIQAEIEEADALLAVSQEPTVEAAGKKRRKRKSLGRTNQIMTRLTDAELVQFQRRLKKSGLPQGEFLRSAVLTGKIVIEDHSVADVTMLDELAMIRAELGRQGGLLKMVIRPNEGQREMAPEEWAKLISAVRDMEKMKKRLSDLEVRVQRGNFEAQNE